MINVKMKKTLTILLMAAIVSTTTGCATAVMNAARGNTFTSEDIAALAPGDDYNMVREKFGKPRSTTLNEDGTRTITWVRPGFGGATGVKAMFNQDDKLVRVVSKTE